MDRRSFTTEFEIRAKATGGAVVSGHGAVFNRLSRNLGGFVEQVDPSAFTKTLADGPDVRALINHDPTHVLGRTRSGTLRIAADSVGLAYEIDMPDRQDARDLMVSLERGDITQSSFAFSVVRGGDSWSKTEEGFPLRTLTALSLHDGDVSPVTYPAYPDADSGLRERAYRSLAAHLGVDPLVVKTAAEENDLRALLTTSMNPVEEPAPVVEDVEEEGAEEQRATHSDSEPEWLTTARRLYGATRRS